MRFQYAKKLHNRDEVEVKVGSNTWASGFVVGDVAVEGKLITMDIQIQDGEFLPGINHTKIR